MTTKSGQQATKPAAKAAAQQQATTTGGAKTPPKDLAALVAQKMAAADAAEKAAEEQRVLVPAPVAEQTEEASEGEAVGEVAKKDLTTGDAYVIALIVEADRQGRVDLKTGNLAYLKSRHQIGELLERHYGGKARQERGKQVVKEISKRHDISTSELYRMWKFFKLRPDFDAFLDEFPDKDSWTAVKELLPSLEGGDVEEKRKKHEHQALIERINDDLKALHKGLTGDLREHVPPAELRELASQLRDTSQEVVALVITAHPVTSPEQPAGVPEEAATT